VGIALLLLAGAAAAVTARSVENRESRLLAERGTAGRDRARPPHGHAASRSSTASAPPSSPRRARCSATARSTTSCAAGLLSRFDAVDVVGVVEEVRDASCPGFLRRVGRSVRASGLAYPPLRIRPPGDRELYNIVSYVHPGAGQPRGVLRRHELARGRRATFERARDNAEPAAPQPIPAARGRPARGRPR
jgi:hypothetical protein